jgi:hypothetical protein
MPTDPANLHSRVFDEANKRRQPRPFGLPGEVTGAHSDPTIFLPHLPAAQALFQGKATITSHPLSRDQQVAQPSTKVSVLLNTTTKETRHVDPAEALRLLREGWVPLGVIAAPPKQKKPLGKL